MTARGMTLIEVMATIAVAAVMTLLSVAGFRGAIDRKKDGAAVEAVGRAALEARTRARQYRQPVRLSVVTTGATRALRWERLECADAWGSACPSAACAGSACGTGGCVCPEVGEAVPLPTDLVLAADLNGLCFRAGSGAPKVKAGGTFCDPAAAAPAAGQLTFWTPTGLSQVLELEPLTGIGRLVDCKNGQKDLTVCP